MFGWHVPCCEALNFSLNGSMFTGVTRMECKALATQQALLRWQMHQRPWAGPPEHAGAVGMAGSPRRSDSLDESSVKAARSGGIPSPWDLQAASPAVFEAGPDARGFNDHSADTLASASRIGPQHSQPAGKLPFGRRQARSGTGDWEKVAVASITAQPPLPTLAELHAERVMDQQLRDVLNGAILRGCGAHALALRPSKRALTSSCIVISCTSHELRHASFL